MNMLTVARLLDMVVGPGTPGGSGVNNLTPRMLLLALLAAIPAFFSWLAVTLFKKN